MSLAHISAPDDHKVKDAKIHLEESEHGAMTYMRRKKGLFDCGIMGTKTTLHTVSSKMRSGMSILPKSTV